MELFGSIVGGLIIIGIGGYFAFKKAKNFASTAKEELGFGISEMSEKLKDVKNDPRFEGMSDEERKGIETLQDLLNKGK